MSYDPRHGSNPYLGMDLEDEGREPSERSQAHQAPSNADGYVDHTPQRTYEEAPRTQRVSSRVAQDVPVTMRRPSQAPQRGVAPRAASPSNTTSQPLVRSPRNTPRAVPSPEQERFEPQPSPLPGMVKSRMSGPLTALESFALLVLAVVLRLAAIGLSALVVLSAVLTGSLRSQLISTLNIAQSYVPAALLGQFVFETPFGGVYRGDLALAALVLFVADWLCVRTAARLRDRYERGR